MNPTAVLTDQDIRDMRTAYQQGATQQQIADTHHVTQSAVSRIVRGVERASAGGPIAAARRNKRLSVAEREQVRAERAKGRTLQDIAAQHGVSETTVHNIIREGAEL